MKLRQIQDLEEIEATEYESTDENVVDLETKRLSAAEKQKAERLETLRAIYRKMQAKKQA